MKWAHHVSLTILVVGCFCIQARAQAGYNFTTKLDLPDCYFRRMLVINDTLICYGKAWPEPLHTQSLLVAKFDTSGNLIAYNVLSDSLGGILSVEERYGFICTSDGGYAMTAVCLSRGNGMFFKLNHALEVEFRREFADKPDIVFYDGLVELPGGYLMAGLSSRANLQHKDTDAYLRKIDKSGNLLWTRYYGEGNTYSEGFFSLTRLNDTLYVATGGYGDKFSDWEGETASVSVIDTFGNVRLFKSPQPENLLSLINKVVLLPNGNLIVNSYKNYGTENAPRVLTSIARLDSQYNIAWYREVGPLQANDEYSDFWGIANTPDGGIIAAGDRKPYDDPLYGPTGGWLFKFSAAGDSLWSRLLYPPGAQTDKHENTLGDVGVLSSGSIVAAGLSNYNNQQYWAWLVKVSPDGCVDTVFCNTVPAFEPPRAGWQSGFSLQPNPTSGQISAIFPETMREDGQITVFDATGRKVSAVNFTGESRVELDLSALPDGLYSVRVQVGCEGLMRKIVVAKN